MHHLKWLAVIFFATPFNLLQAQQETINNLLAKSKKAVASVNEGWYMLSDNSATVSRGEDSSARRSNYRCYFKKLLNDTLTGFKLTSLRDDGYDCIYDGQDLSILTGWTRTLEVASKNKFSQKIKDLRSDYFVFPFFTFLNRQIQQNSKALQIVGTEEVNGSPCYKLQNTLGNAEKEAGAVSYYYISATTYLPVRWYTKLISVVGQSRTEQTFDYSITNLHTGKLPDSVFTKKMLSEYSRVIEFDPNENKHRIQQLAAGNMAPEWELPLISGGTLKLSDLKGKIVVIDFWYKACMPCQKQMIDLETISKKFSNARVAFVGINTIDDPEKEKLITFLKNRNISLLSVYNGKSIEESYQVYGAPALFVIDKDGKIIYSLDGYSYTLSEDLPRIIQAAL